MPLTDTSKDHGERPLLILPYYGYGWNRQDRGASPPTAMDALGPEPFHLDVREYVFCGDNRVGICGVVAEREHRYNGQWCSLCLREVGDFNFTDRPGNYMIWITPSKPQVRPDPGKAIYEWVAFDKSSQCLCGYGTAAESVDWIRDIYEKSISSRRQVLSRES